MAEIKASEEIGNSNPKIGSILCSVFEERIGEIKKDRQKFIQNTHKAIKHDLVVLNKRTL